MEATCVGDVVSNFCSDICDDEDEDGCDAVVFDFGVRDFRGRLFNGDPSRACEDIFVTDFLVFLVSF